MKKALVFLLATFVLFTTGCSAAGMNDKDKGAKKMANPIAVFETNHGTFEIELFEDKAPITVKNFIDLAEKGFYNGLIFHRRLHDPGRRSERHGHGRSWLHDSR